VIPERLGELMGRSRGNVMDALLAMRKIDIGLLEAAAARP
jgi:predicted 3-demethylubiquinone-9 3-methyltransferase (glyoxalase superfamily)